MLHLSGAPQWQFSPDPFAQPGRYALVLDDEDLGDALVDELTRYIFAHDLGAVGVLEAKPVFISNLRVWENIVLPTWYHSAENLTSLDLRLQTILAPFEYQHELLMQQLTQLPAQLDTTHRRLAALFRALLQHPKFLIMDREWLGWLQQSRTRGSLLSQLYDANTETEYLFLITANNAAEGYTPVKVQYGLESGN
jgi:ABC-type lipoprotein export system ATPase subunit